MKIDDLLVWDATGCPPRLYQDDLIGQKMVIVAGGVERLHAPGVASGVWWLDQSPSTRQPPTGDDCARRAPVPPRRTLRADGGRVRRVRLEPELRALLSAVGETAPFVSGPDAARAARCTEAHRIGLAVFERDVPPAALGDRPRPCPSHRRLRRPRVRTQRVVLRSSIVAGHAGFDTPARFSCVRSGRGSGDALHLASGGSALRRCSGSGDAVCQSPSSGDAVRLGCGVGSAFREGGPGSARRRSLARGAFRSSLEEPGVVDAGPTSPALAALRLAGPFRGVLAPFRPLASAPSEVAALASTRPPAAQPAAGADVPVVRVVVSGFRPVALDPARCVRFDSVTNTYVLDDDLPGTLLVVGPGHVDVLRGGRGPGGAVRSGRGGGNAVRSGAGDGAAVRAGGGCGDAHRLGEGTGDAVVRAGVVGTAFITGSARGTALHLGLAGDALNSSSRPGDAVRRGSGAGGPFASPPGAASRCAKAAVPALRGAPVRAPATPGVSGLSCGSAYRRGSGAGSAFRAGSAPGSASRVDGGRGFAVVGAGVRGVAFAPTAAAAQAVVFSVIGDALGPGGAWRGGLPPAASPFSLKAHPDDTDSFPAAVYRLWGRRFGFAAVSRFWVRLRRRIILTLCPGTFTSRERLAVGTRAVFTRALPSGRSFPASAARRAPLCTPSN